MALGDAKSGRDVDPTLRPDSRLASRRPGRQTHGAHRTQGIIFADVVKCPTWEGAQANMNPKALDINPESALWKSNKKGMELVKRFSSYVIKNRINFPSKMVVFPFTRNAGLAS